MITRDQWSKMSAQAQFDYVRLLEDTVDSYALDTEAVLDEDSVSANPPTPEEITAMTTPFVTDFQHTVSSIDAETFQAFWKAAGSS